MDRPAAFATFFQPSFLFGRKVKRQRYPFDLVVTVHSGISMLLVFGSVRWRGGGQDMMLCLRLLRMFGQPRIDDGGLR